MSDYSVCDWLWSFWNMRMIDSQSWSMPINNPLWFVRDLMVLVVLTPLIWLAIKHLKGWFVFVLGGLWIMDFWFDIPGLSISPIFFFSLGAFMGIHKIDFLTRLQKNIVAVVIVYIIFSAIDLAMPSSIVKEPIHRIGDFVGMGAIFGLASISLDTWVSRTCRKLAESSFFVYVYHILPLSLLIKVTLQLVQPHSDILISVLYITIPFFIVGLGILVHKILRHLLPKTTAFITGGRITK